MKTIVVKIRPLQTRCIAVTWKTFLQFVSPRAEKEVNAKVKEKMKEEEEEAAGEDGYEGEEGGGGPCSDVGATAALWRGTTGPIDTAAGGGCRDRESKKDSEEGETMGAGWQRGWCAGTAAGKTAGRWGCGSGGGTTVRERKEDEEARGQGQRWRRVGCRGGGSRCATPAPTNEAPPAADGATIAGILSA